MSEQAGAGHRICNLLPTGIEGSDSLADLDGDMRWRWKHAIGRALLSGGWDRTARRKAAMHFKLEWVPMKERHSLTFETQENGKLTFGQYLERVVFYQKRSFTRRKFRLMEFVYLTISSCISPIRKPDTDTARHARDVAQAPPRLIIYIENTPLFLRIAESLRTRSIIHTEYKSTCVMFASFGLPNKGAIHETR